MIILPPLLGFPNSKTDWQTLQATGSFEAEVANFDKSRLSEVCILENFISWKKSLDIDDIFIGLLEAFSYRRDSYGFMELNIYWNMFFQA